MPRPRKNPPAELPSLPVVAEPRPPEPEPTPMLSVPSAPPVPERVSVGVRNRCPWGVVQSAGSTWGREPTILLATDPRLPELRRCEHLIVVEI